MDRSRRGDFTAVITKLLNKQFILIGSHNENVDLKSEIEGLKMNILISSTMLELNRRFCGQSARYPIDSLPVFSLIVKKRAVQVMVPKKGGECDIRRLYKCDMCSLFATISRVLLSTLKLGINEESYRNTRVGCIEEIHEIALVRGRVLKLSTELITVSAFSAIPSADCCAFVGYCLCYRNSHGERNGQSETHFSCGVYLRVLAE